MAESSAVSAHVIYDALVEYAGAPDNEFWRQTFVDWFTGTDGTEFRFQGALGFGGKLRRQDGRLFVDCYPEDVTNVRRKMIARTNDALAALYGAV